MSAFKTYVLWSRQLKAKKKWTCEVCGKENFYKNSCQTVV